MGADGYTGDRLTRSGKEDAGLARITEAPFVHLSDPAPGAQDGYQPLYNGLDAAFSCQYGLARQQRRVMINLAAGLALFGLTLPGLALTVMFTLLWIAFSILISWRLFLIVAGLAVRAWPKRHRRFPPSDMPVYSILVAAYDEAAVMPQLAGALRQIVWPSDKLDIQILLEADDEATLAAARDAGFPPGTRLTIVPAGGVRTKANALNYGLTLARGSFACVYDAEDRPHPGQVLEAWRAFQSAKRNVACVQAPLVGDNGHRAMIAAHWSLEYATQFGLLVPAMAALRLPIPIGGTSNHFRMDVLRGLGGWDAFNVTEDADLGLRLSRFGRRVVMLNLPTFEDAPTELSVWFAQRSRWIKGFVQTWYVLMRRPSLLWRQLGAARFVTVQLALGGAILAPLFHAPMLLVVIAAATTQAFSIGTVGSILLGTGLAVGLLGDVVAPGPWHGRRVAAILTRPLYWPLHSVSAARAIWELAAAPHFWAKTPHTPHTEPGSPSWSIGSPA